MMHKHYHFQEAEPAMQEFWRRQEIYRFRPDSGKEIFSIDTPPPTVSGNLHIGHLFSYTQAEIAARFRRMQGYEVYYPSGFDDNGLPTERLVERQMGSRAKDLDRQVFIQKCMETAETYEKDFREFWQSLGFSVDWTQQYRTISPEVQRISQYSFLELAGQGKAYMKESPVLWCTECQTSVAQAELDTREQESTFHYLLFHTAGQGLPVATTRPELLYGCVCLFVHPDDVRYQSYIGQKAVVPLYEYEVPILADSLVSMEKGTGIVMCATFGDSTDAEWYTTHNLPYREVLLSDGKIHADVPYIGGLSVKAARQKIKELLREKGWMIREEPIRHTVAVHERCGTEIEIIHSRQWYIDILTQKQALLQAADRIHWYPAAMKARYTAWTESLKWDWCISRQRYFGVPLPVWYCNSCGLPVFAEEKQLPVDPLSSRPLTPCRCGSIDFTPETAVLDTWATSSVTPQIHSHWQEKNDAAIRIALPMSLRVQAHEIIRTWAFYTIVKSLYHTGEIPWNDLMISGFVLAKKGEKISKSKNNESLDPQKLIAVHSADALRYWAAGTRLGTDTFFSEEELAVSKRMLTKLWNAARFASSHLSDFHPESIPELMPADRFILARAAQTKDEAAELLNQYEIGLARHTIDSFFWQDFCDYYLELIKERLYQPEKHGAQARLSGQYALYYTVLEILKLYAIYIPHITEFIYQNLFREYETEISLHQILWGKGAGGVMPESSILEFGKKLKEAIAGMRRYKSEHNLSLNAEMPCLRVDPGPYIQWFQQTEKDLLACSHAQEILFISD